MVDGMQHSLRLSVQFETCAVNVVSHIATTPEGFLAQMPGWTIPITSASEVGTIGGHFRRGRG